MSDFHAEYSKRIALSMEKIVAEHPRMGTPPFKAALVNAAIGENLGWFCRQKDKMMEAARKRHEERNHG